MKNETHDIGLNALEFEMLKIDKNGKISKNTESQPSNPSEFEINYAESLDLDEFMNME